MQVQPDEDKKPAAVVTPPSALVQIFSIGQWWFFNVATVILNKYIFQGMVSTQEGPGAKESKDFDCGDVPH